MTQSERCEGAKKAGETAARNGLPKASVYDSGLDPYVEGSEAPGAVLRAWREGYEAVLPEAA